MRVQFLFNCCGRGYIFISDEAFSWLFNTICLKTHNCVLYRQFKFFLFTLLAQVYTYHTPLDQSRAVCKHGMLSAVCMYILDLPLLYIVHSSHFYIAIFKIVLHTPSQLNTKAAKLDIEHKGYRIG